MRLAWHSILALVARSSVARAARATTPALKALASLPVKRTWGAARDVPRGRPGWGSAEPLPPAHAKAAAFPGHDPGPMEEVLFLTARRPAGWVGRTRPPLRHGGPRAGRG